MITNSYTIQKREREPESEKTLFDILAYAEKFISEKNCKCDIKITRGEKVLKIENFSSLENLEDNVALQIFKISSLKINVLSKYVYQNYPVLDNNPEDEKKPAFLVELLKLDIIL